VSRRERRLTAVRHAPPRERGVCYGRAEIETSIDPQAAAVTILRELPRDPEFSVVWSSPSRRCAEPAAILARDLALPRRVDERLFELSFGDWEGIPWVDLQRRHSAALRDWADHWQTRSCPGGETVADLTRRVGSWVTDLSGGEHLVVAHAGVVRALRVLLDDRSWDQAMAEPVACLRPMQFVTCAPR
jgi:alpha-ribazole phosphatase